MSAINQNSGLEVRSVSGTSAFIVFNLILWTAKLTENRMYDGTLFYKSLSLIFYDRLHIFWRCAIYTLFINTRNIKSMFHTYIHIKKQKKQNESYVLCIEVILHFHFFRKFMSRFPTFLQFMLDNLIKNILRLYKYYYIYNT